MNPSSIGNSKRSVASVNYIFGIINLVLNAFSGLLLLPLYIKKLNNIQEYGVWLACLGIISSLGVLELNLSGVATQKYSQGYQVFSPTCQTGKKSIIF